MIEYKIHIGQTIYDVALMFYGDASQVYTILKNNPHLGDLNTINLSGITVLVDDNTGVFINKIRNEKTILNTGTPTINDGVPFDFGFDFGFES